jgi:hypothetical protein
MLSSESQTQQQQVSCRLDPNGWAWLVSGRRLYVWRHSQDGSNKKSSIACRELILPPSELVHNAQLVSVVTTGSSVCSCIAVSPEGHITFWPNLSNESSTITFSADVPVGLFRCGVLESEVIIDYAFSIFAVLLSRFRARSVIHSRHYGLLDVF